MPKFTTYAYLIYLYQYIKYGDVVHPLNPSHILSETSPRTLRPPPKVRNAGDGDLDGALKGGSARRHLEDLLLWRGGRRDGLGLAARGGSATPVGASSSTPPPVPKSLVQIKIEELELTEVRYYVTTPRQWCWGPPGENRLAGGRGWGLRRGPPRSRRLLAGQVCRGRRRGDLGWQRRGGKLWLAARMCRKATTWRRARYTHTIRPQSNNCAVPLIFRA
jgi:hypothetical protein